MIIPRFIRLVILMSLPALTAACASADRPVALPGEGDAAITRGAVRALRSHWSGVELGSSRSATCPTTSGAPTPLVRGDINGDGFDDIVLWVTVGGTPRLAALLARLDGEYSVVEVGDVQAGAPVTLELGRRGTVYRPAAMAIDFFFGADTIVLRECDGARMAWFWTGDAFQPQPLAN